MFSVCWCGFCVNSNDLARGATPSQTAGGFTEFAEMVSSKLPDTQILFLSILRSPYQVCIRVSNVFDTNSSTWGQVASLALPVAGETHIAITFAPNNVLFLSFLGFMWTTYLSSCFFPLRFMETFIVLALQGDSRGLDRAVSWSFSELW